MSVTYNLMKKLLIMALALSVVVVAGCSISQEDEQKIEFAQCLTDAGFKMYGATWCGHCKDQKERFGAKAFDKIDYVECTKQETLCDIAGVTWYPTWTWPDYKQASVHTFEQLAKASGCEFGEKIELTTQEDTVNETPVE